MDTDVRHPDVDQGLHMSLLNAHTRDQMAHPSTTSGIGNLDRV